MAVGFEVSFYWYQVGNGDFLNSFFSTIAYKLEKREWGSKFPVIMNDLYQGEIAVTKLNQALKEIKEIKSELKEYPPTKVIWDIEDLTKQPPWGEDICAYITDLSNYFVTSEGEDLILLLQHALELAIKIKSPLLIGTM